MATRVKYEKGERYAIIAFICGMASVLASVLSVVLTAIGAEFDAPQGLMRITAILAMFFSLAWLVFVTVDILGSITQRRNLYIQPQIALLVSFFAITAIIGSVLL